jgi:hypothetical protein
VTAACGLATAAARAAALRLAPEIAQGLAEALVLEQVRRHVEHLEIDAIELGLIETIRGLVGGDGACVREVERDPTARDLAAALVDRALARVIDVRRCHRGVVPGGAPCERTT